VESVQLIGIELQFDSGTLEGDNVITDVASNLQSVGFRIRFGFKDLEVLEILTGIVNTESTYNESMILNRATMPYFAVCGKVLATEGGGDTHIFLPKCKLTENFGLSMEKGAYITPEIPAMAVYEGATYGMGKIINNATAKAVTIPPIGATS
jgi:hypothetical protein